jgi:trimethylamine--corrinoid protein Co-methyltransferase
MSDPTPALQPIRSAYRLQMLDDQQLRDFRAGTLEILEDVGVRCPSDRALSLYAAHGARVDLERRIVRLPPDMVLSATAQAPRTNTMGGRSAAHDLLLDGTALYAATDGCGIETVDFVTRERRASTRQDVADMARVADALPSVGFYWPIVSAQDHPATAPLHELAASYGNTVKHVQTETVMGERMARYAVEMAKVIAGDEATLRARPPLSSLICCIAPLAQDRGGVEAALVFAEAGVPVGFMSMANAGSTGPATVPGTIVAGDAEIVAALVLVQLAYPGAPVFHSLMTGVMDPRTGAHLATTWEGEAAYAAGVELAHGWGVPTLAGIFGTDATAPGWEAAAASAVALTICALCGAETGSGMGLLDACTVLYPEQLILDADIYQRVRNNLARLDTSREALALDVIRDVGPGGSFLFQAHTRDEMRRRVFSDLTNRTAPEGGVRDPIDVAREKVARILAEHHPEPLEEAKQAELERILAAAEREIAASSTPTAFPSSTRAYP